VDIYVSPVPVITQVVEAIFNAVANPFSANVRVPDAPVAPKRTVSPAVGIVILPVVLLYMESAVPTAKGTDAFVGIVTDPAAPDSLTQVFASASTKV
jgi:hypothetical protein